jgi:hypothetical protein
MTSSSSSSSSLSWYVVQEHVKIGYAALHAILKASNGDMRKGEWMIHSSMHFVGRWIY